MTTQTWPFSLSLGYLLTNSTELLHANFPYTISRCDRNGRRGGGVFVFTNNSIPSYQLPNNCTNKILSVPISVPTFTCVRCYRLPDCDPSFIDKLDSVLLDVTSKLPRANNILCGDFNFQDIKWVNLTASHQSKDFLDLALNFNLTQTVNFPTCATNTLDLVLTSHPKNIESLSSVDGLSDHSIILFNLTIPVPIRQRSLKF